MEGLREGKGLQEPGRAGRHLRTRVDHGETGVSVGTSVALGISVAVLMEGSVGVADGRLGIRVFVCEAVGITTPGTVAEGMSEAPGGTRRFCPVCRTVELPRQLARWRSATVIP